MTGMVRCFTGCLVLVLFSAAEISGVERVYYVGIIEALWDYAPSGKNLVNGHDIADDLDASYFLQRGQHRIGGIYYKAMFRQFTDGTYSRQSPRPEALGFLGPVLRAEVDDIIVVHLKNFASRNYSMHPHGVFYKKDSEGALYPDKTFGKAKLDDAVPHLGTYTYRWEVRPEFAPTEDDVNCLTWVYHSHVDAPRDIASGLIGALLTCKKGILKPGAEGLGSDTGSGPDPARSPERNDVDRDVFLMFTVVNEGMSWYLEENINTFCTDPAGVDPEDPDFMESNLMHSINGYMYGNLPGIELCQHRPAAWHLFGMGNEEDIHSAYFHGNTILDRGHRTDVVSLFPATFATAEMFPTAVGKWLLSCQVNDHLVAGMQSFYTVKTCGESAPPPPSSGVVRQYYLAAEEIQWDYAPSGMDLINNVSLTEDYSTQEVFFGKEGGRIGGRYKKAVYKAYTDATFTTPVPSTPETQHLGILGPVLRVEEGDTLQVTFMNKAKMSNYSILPHGLQYEKRFQGANYQDGVHHPGADVVPGGTFVYSWQVYEGPSPSDPACIPYLYYSAHDAVYDPYSGLVGPLLVCKKGTLEKNKAKKSWQKELFLLFSVMDENLSGYLMDNVEMYGTNETDLGNEEFQESNKMHAVNGYMYGNLPGLDMCLGDTVVWYTFGLGTEIDIHNVYFEGNTFQRYSTTRDTASLFPHTAATLVMQPRASGVYELSCKVTDHYSSGMRHQYKVKDCPGRSRKRTDFQPSQVVRYYISAEEVEWDYSPSRDWELEKHHTTAEESPGNIFVGKGENRIGSRYKKVVYREYTDDSFTVRKKQRSDQKHLGILGPVIRAEVGERIIIIFKNKAKHSYTIHPHGVSTVDSHTPVQPGFMTDFTWDVLESSGPGASDPNCISYAYYSTVDFIKDLYSGLLGPLVVCRRGTLDHGLGTDRRRTDVDEEFALLFLVFDENQSWYMSDNIRTYLNTDPDSFIPDQDFQESNLMHGINGRLYGNLGGLVMTEGHTVAWYLLGMGNEVDMHTVHFHAETFTYKMDRTHRADVFDLFPGTFQTLEMVAGNPGEWLLHCHVTDHILAGMETTFTIQAGASGGVSRVSSLFLPLVLAVTAALHC